MKYAIIAAGEGSRLAKEGINSPKPLVKINGERLIDRLLRIFTDNGAEEIIVICNSLTQLVSNHLDEIQQHGLNGRHIPLRYVVKTTPSSMHSFFEISPYLTSGPFCMTTVDTIFRENEFCRYIRAFKENMKSRKTDGMMGITDFIDDEKPLYVDVDGGMNIIGFLDKSDSCHYISCGIYGLTPTAITVLHNCVRRGESRMRNFQRALVNSGRHLTAYAFSKVLDIDHAADITKAEQFLNQSA